MATIKDLKTSFLDMEDDEKFFLIRRIREARRTKPETPKSFKKSGKGKRAAGSNIKKSKKNSKIDPMTLLSSMSPEEKQKLLKELGYND